MATTVTAKRRMSVETLERIGAPEGRWELIDGELVEMNPSSSRASKIGVKFAYFLTDHTLPSGLGDIFGADAGFRVIVDGVEMVRVPDAAFVRAERVPASPDDEGYYRLAPDLAVEVNSPTDRASDVLAKAMMWLDAGVRLVWVADPPTQTITVYHADRSSVVLRAGDELTGADVLPQFRQPVTAFFR